MAEVVINDLNYRQFLVPVVGGELKGRGGLPRDFMRCPVGYLPMAKPFDLPLIPEAQQQTILDAQVANQARLSDLRNVGNAGQPIPSRDQDGVGYCWCHSGVSACLLTRAVMGAPYVDLSAFSVGCMIKGYRDEGGWGSEGVEFIGSRGVATAEFWPQQSMSRSNDKPATWENAKLHRFTEWMDLDPRNMRQQLITCLLMGLPVVVDFNWWSHSVCAMDLVKLNPLTIRIWNSWGDTWSEKGTGLLEGGKALPDGALACRVSTPSTA